MKNAIFWDVTPCGFYKSKRFGGTYRLHHQGDKNRQLATTLAVTTNRSALRRNTIIAWSQHGNSTVFLRSMLRILVTAYFVPSSPIIVTLMI
jgi:hypothetical protein